MKNKILIGIVIAVLILSGLVYLLNNNPDLFSGKIKTIKTQPLPANNSQTKRMDLGFETPALTIKDKPQQDSIYLTVHFKNTNITTDIIGKPLLLGIYIDNSKLKETEALLLPSTGSTISNDLLKFQLPKCKLSKIKVVIDPDNKYIETNENNNTAELEFSLFSDGELIPKGVYYYCDSNKQLSTGEDSTADFTFATPAIKVENNPLNDDLVHFTIFYNNINVTDQVFKQKIWLEKKLKYIDAQTASNKSVGLDIMKNEIPKCTPVKLDVKLDPDEIFTESKEDNNNTQFIFTILNDGKVVEGKSNC